MTHEELRARWGERLRAARRAKGVSLRAITDATGLHKSHYCRVEAGDASASDTSRMRIAAALGVRVEDIWAYPAPAADGSGR